MLQKTVKKTAKKYGTSIIIMVSTVLRDANGGFLSVTEIQQKITEKYNCGVHKDGVYRSLYTLGKITPAIFSEMFREGARKIPVKKYSIKF